ncbi:MAG TPA: STAS domain-containing protein [Pyrinomonadaceae bacterium]|nr:STAS domain-containing protein [Pyrinomonadaceae bacterium]
MQEPFAAAPPNPLGGDGVAIVYAGDYVNKQSGQRIERECLLRIEGGCRALVINFRDTELVNSIGVSILLGVIDAAEQSGARIIFSNVSRHTVKLFELLGLTRLVVLADSEEAALATLNEFIPTPNGH